MTRFLGGSTDWLTDDARWGLSSWDYYRRGPATTRDPNRWSTLWPRSRTDGQSGSWAEWQIFNPGKALRLASSPDTPRVWLVKATPYNPDTSGEVSVYFSTGRPDMAAPVYDGVLWPVRLTTPLNTETTVFTGEFGGAVPTFGNIQIELAGGDQDALLGYYWDGRDVSVYRGPQDGGLSDMSLVFKGTARSVSWNRETVTINLADFGEIVQKPVQTTQYAGTGSAEGGDDLKGKPKPLAFGAPKNIEPTLISSAYLVYQFHSRAAQGVDAAFDGGMPLDYDTDYASYSALIAATIKAGKYATCLAEGLVRLGAPVAMLLTLDVKGDNTGGYVTTAADIMRRVAENFTDLTSGDIDVQAFNALNAANSAACSIYVGTGESPAAADLFTQLMISVGGFWTFTAERKLTVRQVAFSTPVVTISYDYGPLALNSVSRDETLPPYWRRKMGYSRAWRVHSESEIAGGVAGSAIAIDINYEDFATVSNGKAWIHGLNDSGARADVDGTYYYGSTMVTVPRAQFADGSTLQTSQTATGFFVHDYDPVTPSFIDYFTGSASTNLTAHSPDTGTSWTDQTATTRTWILDGTGKATPSSTSTNVRVIYTAAAAPGSADMFSEFQLDAQPPAATGTFGLLARYQSTSSFYVLSLFTQASANSPMGCQLRRVTGVSTSSDIGGSIENVPFVAGMKFRLSCVGTTLTASYRNPGTSIWTKIFEATDANIALAGNGGIFTGAVTGSTPGLHTTATGAKVSNYRDGTVKGAWTVNSEKVAVAFCRYSDGWQYDTGAGWTSFTRTSSMLIIGSMERGASSITSAALTQPQVIPSTDAQTVIIRGAFIRERQRFVTTSDTAVQTRHKLAREAEVASLLDNSSDATTENARQFALLDSKWDTYRVPIRRKDAEDFRLKLGDTVTLKLNRFGLSNGKDVIIGGMASGSDADELILTLWG